MDQTQIKKVASVLAEWNPLGNKAQNFTDLEGYRTEAIDIISVFRLPIGGTTATSKVMTVLNQAFELTLSESDCAEAAKKIALILEQHKN